MAYPRKLCYPEFFWRDIYGILQERGYTLRKRYHHDWVPSCPETEPTYAYEDAYELQDDNILDAKDRSGRIVIMKKMKHDPELEILRQFTERGCQNDPQNHVVPLLDTHSIPMADRDEQILVLPLLRQFDSPEFRTVGELIDFIRQIFEGVAFMHRHHVAHMDLQAKKFMMDHGPLLETDFHPMSPHKTYDFTETIRYHKYRTKHPVKYYVVGFGAAQQYHEGSSHERGALRRETSHRAPELHSHQSEHPYDPFALDVYDLGLIIRQIIEPFEQLECLRNIIRDMTLANPSARPTMEKVVHEFNKDVLQSLTDSQLRARLKKRDESALGAMYRGTRHFFKGIGLRKFPAVPDYRTTGGRSNGHAS